MYSLARTVVVFFFFFFNDTATTEIYTLSLHDALPIYRGVGAITDSDVLLAKASNAIIIGFHVRPDSNARASAEREKVEIRTYRIIYEAVEEVKAAMAGLLAPEKKEVVLGEAEVRQLFKIAKVGTIGGG